MDSLGMDIIRTVSDLVMLAVCNLVVLAIVFVPGHHHGRCRAASHRVKHSSVEHLSSLQSSEIDQQKDNPEATCHCGNGNPSWFGIGLVKRGFIKTGARQDDFKILSGSCPEQSLGQSQGIGWSSFSAEKEWK